jgi:uncharacterized DUF497 family protein
MRFEWDADKAKINRRKHKIPFEMAIYAFFDPDRLDEYDDTHSVDEDRWKLTGMVIRGVIVVIYTKRNGDTIRIISARRANEQERAEYYHY